MQNKISRRDFLKLGATGAAAAFLASCATPAAPTAAPAETAAPVATEPVKQKVTIDFLAWVIMPISPPGIN